MRHTKGKWVVSPRWSYRKGISAKDTIQNEPDGYSVDAHVERKTLGGQDSPYDIAIASMQTYSNGKRPMDEVKANANLISVAPEMLQELKAIELGLNHTDSDWAKERLGYVRKIIDRAEGK